MASFWEVVAEALIAYWASPLSLSVLVASFSAMGTLGYVFLTNARNAKLRVSLLTGLYGLSIFFWSFVAVSLILCVSQARMVAYSRDGVPLAVASAIVAGLALSAVVSFTVWRFGNRSVLRRFMPRATREGERWLQEYVDLLAELEGMRGVEVGIVESPEAIAMAVGGRSPHILISTGLLGILDGNQTETVLAHEVMHLRHHDAEFKVFSRVLSRALVFDPFTKFFDPAVHREREYLADETSARMTGKPAALASALLRIASQGPPARGVWGLSILGPGRGVFSRYPPLGERVHRLLLLSQLIPGSRSHSGKS